MDIDRIVATVRDVVGASPAVALHEPSFDEREWRYVKECLDSGWVSASGPFVDRIEAQIAAITGAAHVVSTVNGTCALQLVLRVLGIGAGDEVLVPTLTFAGTVAPIVHSGAIPHFVDVEPDTLGIDAAKLRRHLQGCAEVRDGVCHSRASGNRIAAAIAVHTYGHPVDLDAVADVCGQFGVALIEDAAESLGSTYKGRHTGNDGAFAVMSFNGNKIATAGGGGAVLTNDEALGKRARHLATTAKVPHRWEMFHDQAGFNFRMPNLNAALLSAQLEKVPEAVEHKRALAKSYADAFAGVSGASVFTEAPFARSNYWLNVLVLDRSETSSRDALLGRLNDAGIGSRPSWALMHQLPAYSDAPCMDLATAEDFGRRIINLPSSPGLARRADVPASQARAAAAIVATPRVRSGRPA